MTDGAGIPLSVSMTGGNRDDVTELEPLLDAIPPVRAVVAGHDRAYDHDKYRKKVRTKGQVGSRTRRRLYDGMKRLRIR